MSAVATARIFVLTFFVLPVLSGVLSGTPAHADERRMAGSAHNETPKDTTAAPEDAAPHKKLDDGTAPPAKPAAVPAAKKQEPAQKPESTKTDGTTAPDADDSDNKDAAKKAAPAPAAATRTVPVRSFTQSTRKRTQNRGPVNFSALESLGTLTTPRAGSLGIDLWDNSDRSTVARMTEDAPGNHEYATLARLQRRAFLTATEASMMNNRGAVPAGEDLLTLRIEALNRMGAFSDAAALYALNTQEAYHQRLVYAGAIALLAGGQTALGCLEVEAMGDRFDNDEDWKNLGLICDYFLVQMGGNKDAAAAIRNELERSGALDNSKILERVVTRENFRMNMKSLEDFTSLSLLEKIVLINEGRIDYSGLRKLDFATMDAASASLLLKDPDLPESVKFRTMRHAVERGIVPVSVMADYYKGMTFEKLATTSESLGEYKRVKLWKRVPYIYKSMSAAESGLVRAHLAALVLDIADEYGEASLLPFADMLTKVNAEPLSDKQIKAGLKVMLLDGAQIPKDWKKRWESIPKTKAEDYRLQAAYDVSGNFSTEKSGVFLSKILENKNLTNQQKLLLSAVYEKLDKKEQMENSTPTGAYEKSPSLTSDADYVMPSQSVMDSLKQARTRKRVGEVILLSAQILHEASPHALHPELFREIPEGLKDVGLRKEAQSLSTEIILWE